MGRPMGCVYVAQGASGLTKVGYTTNVRVRRYNLRQQFRRFGDEFVRFQSFDEIACYWGAEHRLVTSMASRFTQYSGREWFESADFDVASALAKDATEQSRNIKVAPPLSAKKVAAIVAEYAKVRADRRAAADASKAEYKARIQLRRDIRAKRRAEIAERMGSKAKAAQ